MPRFSHAVSSGPKLRVAGLPRDCLPGTRPHASADGGCEARASPAVGISIRANSGIHFATGSSSDSLPSSRSLRIASAVKLFVIDAIRKAVSAVMRSPTVCTCASRPSMTTPHTIPGICFDSAYRRKIRRFPAAPPQAWQVWLRIPCRGVKLTRPQHVLAANPSAKAAALTSVDDL